MINRDRKAKELAGILDEVEKYLDDHILYNKDLVDVTHSVLDNIHQLNDLLSKSQNSLDEFHHFQKYANPFNMYVITSIHYPDDENETISLMRKLVDAITNYNSNCAPELRKTSAQSSLFYSSSDAESSSEDALTRSPMLTRKH